MAVSQDGNLPMVKSLLRERVDIEAVDSDGDTALIYAIESNQMQVIEALVDAGANMEVISNHVTPLMRAIEMDNTDVALYLIERHAHIGQYYDDKSPLMMAAEVNNVIILQALLNRGVLLPSHVNMALHSACEHNASACVSRLLMYNASPNYTVGGGITPLMEAVASSSNTEIVKSLLEAGADILATDADGWNVFMHFTKSKDPSPETLDVLLQAYVRNENSLRPALVP